MSKCGDCKWWENHSDLGEEYTDEGYCRRRSPFLIDALIYQTGDAADSIDAVWPVTTVKDYCGEFQEIKPGAQE